MMKQLFFGLAVAGLMACGSPERETGLFTIDMQTVLGEETPAQTLTAWNANVEYVPLETNDSALIKFVQQILFDRDRFLVVHGGNTLSVFDRQGHFVRNIGRQGNGPGEYSSVFDVRLKGEEIYVRDYAPRVFVYDWKGRFLRSFEQPELAQNLFFAKGNDMALAYVPNLTGESQTRFYLMKDGEVLDSIPNRELFPKAAFVMTFYPEFFPTQGNQLCGFTELYSDTIYRVTDDLRILPYAALRTGKYQPTKAERYGVDPGEVRNNPMKGKKPVIVLGEAGEQLYLFVYGGYDKTRFFCYDERSGQVEALSLTYPANDFEFAEEARFVPNFLSADNQYLMDWEQPENEENPVIVLVKVNPK